MQEHRSTKPRRLQNRGSWAWRLPEAGFIGRQLCHHEWDSAGVDEACLPAQPGRASMAAMAGFILSFDARKVHGINYSWWPRPLGGTRCSELRLAHTGTMQNPWTLCAQSSKLSRPVVSSMAPCMRATRKVSSDHRVFTVTRGRVTEKAHTRPKPPCTAHDKHGQTLAHTSLF